MSDSDDESNKLSPPALPEGKPLYRGMGRNRGNSDEMVRQIMQAMSSGAWKSGTSNIEFAERWSLSVGHINELAAEAGRNVRRAVGNDREAVVGAMIAQIESIGESAHAAGGKALDTALKALELKAKILRLIESPGVRPQPPADWASLTPEQKAQRIAEGRAYLDQLESDLRASMAITVTITTEGEVR